MPENDHRRRTNGLKIACDYRVGGATRVSRRGALREQFEPALRTTPEGEQKHEDALIALFHGPFSAQLAMLIEKVGQTIVGWSVRAGSKRIMKQNLKLIAIDALEDRFGEPVADALRKVIGPDADNEDGVLAWGGAQAKDHLSELMTRALAGECQVVRRRSDEPVLMMSMERLEKFVGQIAPQERWADWIANEPLDALDVGVVIVANAPTRVVVGAAETGAAAAWGVAQAKGRFKELLDRVLEGESQFLRRPRQEVVLLTCGVGVGAPAGTSAEASVCGLHCIRSEAAYWCSVGDLGGGIRYRDGRVLKVAAYLLGTQAFVDASRNDVTNPVRRWSSCYDVALDDAFVSAASFMPIRTQLEMLETAQRINWQILFETAMDKYERAGRIVPVSHRIAARAGELATTAVQLRAGGNLGEVSLLVVATALTLGKSRNTICDTLVFVPSSERR